MDLHLTGYVVDAVKRLRTELLRIYSVLEDHLSGRHTGGLAREYLAGSGVGKFSIADMGTWPHVRGYRTASGLSDEEMAAFPSLLAWIARIAARPAAQEGISDKYSSGENPDAVLRSGL